MNKKALIAVALIIVIAAAYLFINQNKTKIDTAGNMPETRLADDSEMKGNESLRALALKGKPLQCEIKQDANTSGKFYIAGENMRSDFTTTVDGKTSTGHMIMVDNVSYTWMDNEKTGFKMTLSDSEINETETSAQKQETIDIDSKVDYNCSSWSKDNSYFNVPSDVSFTDLSAMMNTNTSGGADLKAIQCAACESAPPESRADCKAALGCN